ncbi:D-alanyl-D-alanine carboxypeptidase family protein [Candidatus Contendibacter odensensis]|uniref:serine-type D-Ala-D-Ala carboxypeptidase n=1 Tax=Candidatus Contendobacter odensis Run_B_J11 TaxID=1400861 RepID=A0A7U7J495_9GAMM|nr:D-alanyl-D-alanine carboxypeptidase family protein [Candidatus Contendobacter odensis]CDH45017.1 D-alanyl-D-alanine carboxypeptidase [Candidatus Contendobacter odensis Run_B_J11]
MEERRDMPLLTLNRTLFLPLLALALLALSGIAANAESIPPPPQVPVRSYVLMDYQSGNLLANLKGDERMEPASITKLMTAYVVYKALKTGKIHLNDQVTISEKAWRTAGSKMFVKVGSQVPVEDLLMGMVVQSGNDATVALAEHVAGSEETFAKLMNQEAERLGMKNSHFTNAPGLPDANHYMSAHDIALLTRALIQDFPDQYPRYSVRSFKYNNIEQQNRNRLLLTDASVDGVKTGHTESAGYCLVSSAKRNDTRLIGVVLGAAKEKERFQASQALLNYGFSFFESRKLHDANTPIVTARIWKGQANQLPLGVIQPLYVTVPKGQAPQVSTTTTVQPTIIAPAQKDQPFGEIVVKLGDQEVSKTPLVALQDVPESGWFGRMIDAILLFFHSLFN